MIIMEEIGKSAVNALEEVKKLQELVRKLETQNEQLRNKQGQVSNKLLKNYSPDNLKCSSSQLSNLKKNYILDSQSVISNDNDYGANAFSTFGERSCEGLSYLDEIEMISFNDADLSDDDSWLYTSPKGLTPEHKLESPYQWLRKDVDDLENKELQLAKKALIKKLNEFEILSPTSQRNQQHYVGQICSGLQKSSVSCRPLPINDCSPNCHFDTRTFTKSKKKQAMEYLASTMLMERSGEVRTDNSLCRRGSDISLDSLSGIYTMTDANDVHEVARIQEESLRLSSPVGGTPKRHSAASSHSSRRISISSRSSDADNVEHTHSVDCHRSKTTTLTSISRESSNFSDHSSPSASPYGSSASLDSVSNDKDEKYRRSLPNLNRGTSKLSRSPVSTDRKQIKKFISRKTERQSDSNLHLAVSEPPRETMSPIGQKLKQPSCFSSPASNVTAHQTTRVKQLMPPTLRRGDPVNQFPAKCGLPKRTKGTAKLSSGIPVSSTPNRNNMVEDSWSEGCY